MDMRKYLGNNSSRGLDGCLLKFYILVYAIGHNQDWN